MSNIVDTVWEKLSFVVGQVRAAFQYSRVMVTQWSDRVLCPALASPKDRASTDRTVQ
jgi:hypothetical protein